MDHLPFHELEAWRTAQGLSLAKAASLFGVRYSTAYGWKRKGFVDAAHAAAVRAALADPAPPADAFCRRAHAEALIEGLGGVTAVAERFEVAPASVSGWKAHGVPGDRLAALLEAAKIDSGVSGALRAADAAGKGSDERAMGGVSVDRYAARRARLADLVKDRFGDRQLSLAEATGISPSYIANMLCDPGRKGHKRIGEDMVDRIEMCLSIPGWFAGADAVAVERPGLTSDGKQATSVIALLPVLETVRARLPLNEWEGLVSWLKSTAAR